MSDNAPSSGSAFCIKCGTPLAPGAEFCARCGTKVSPTTGPASGTSPPPIWDRHVYREWRRQQRRQYYEKSEKHEKGEKNEKGSGGGSMIGPIMGAAILIWLGITLYLQQLNDLPSSNWWAYFIAGVGVIIIIQGIARYIDYRGPYLGSVIGGAVLFLIGIGYIAQLSLNFWPLILIVIGIALVASALIARRHRPMPSSQAS